MVVYIRQSKLPSEVSINKYHAQVGAYLQGEEVILYQSFSEIKELTSEDIVVDYIIDLFGNCKKCYTIFMETVYDKAQKL
ncbi:hypothetical protein AADI23_07265, partial [Streptococcus pneumoniae]